MKGNELVQQLAQFRRWKRRQEKTLGQLAPWLKQQGLYTAEAHNAIESTRVGLHDDSLTVAIIGEYSRGKTELINSLFFSDHGRRLLPTDAGRTTMCPTEIYHDPAAEPGLKLLPIQTRLHDISLMALREDDSIWESKAFDLDDPGQMESCLLEISASRRVNLEEAKALGLDGTDFASVMDHAPPGTLDIPKWRMARINFPHPLLEQGVRILDTPGLNTLGTEPELTYEILPAAHAVLFVLGVDTGVTRSDLDTWERYIRQPGDTQRAPGTMIILNKTDTLWDELRSREQVEQSISRQCAEVAAILQVDPQNVFATSAQKALIARIRQDRELEERSGIRAAERHLAEQMIGNRRELIMTGHNRRVRDAMATLEDLVASRLKRNLGQLRNLEALSGKSEAAVNHMLQETRREKERYQASVDAYHKARAEFEDHGRTLLSALNLETLDKVVEEARQKMSGAWTTHGLREAMTLLFSDINQRMAVISNQTQSMRKLVRTIYRRFQTDHGFMPKTPAMFSIVKHQVELGLLDQEAEIFRKSPRTTLTEQHFVVKRYFRTIVQRAQRIFSTAREDAQQWLNAALDPLTLEIREHRTLLTSQVKDLKQAGQSRNTLQQRIQVLQREARRLKAQRESLANVQAALNRPMNNKPQVVRSEGSASAVSG